MPDTMSDFPEEPIPNRPPPGSREVTKGAWEQALSAATASRDEYKRKLAEADIELSEYRKQEKEKCWSVLHSPQNWSIPNQRREVYTWNRFFCEFEPKIGLAMDFYSEFPVVGLEIGHKDANIKKYFENLNEKLRVAFWSKHILREACLLGDAFPFTETECDACCGTGINKEGKECEHKGGTIGRIILLNPDWIDVQNDIFTDEPVISLLPDNAVKLLVRSRKPAQLYERIPVHVREKILSGKPVILNNSNVYHYKNNPHPYGTYGTSITRCLFRALAFKEKLLTAQWIVTEGSPEMRIIKEQIDLLDEQVSQGLCISPLLLSDQLGGIQAEALVVRMLSMRKNLAYWIEHKVYEPVARMQGFDDWPRIIWQDDLRARLKELLAR